MPTHGAARLAAFVSVVGGTIPSGSFRRVRRVAVSATFVGLALIAGCGGGTSGEARRPTSTSTSTPTTTPTATSTTAAATTAGAGPAPSAPLASLPPNPASPAIIVTPGEDVANPAVLVDDRYYMYATQTTGAGHRLLNIPVRVSDDLRRWQVVGDALPVLPPWAVPGATWAPDVRKIGGRYVMYFTVRLAGRPKPTECIGLATANSPLGPFSATPEPFVCQLDHRGSIDPRTFVDTDGSLWLHWKADDNANGASDRKTSVWAQRLTADGLHLTGSPTLLFGPDQVWEGIIVEAPHMVLAHGIYWVVYSANWYNESAYSLGIAACRGPAGPCVKALPRPWLGSNAQGKGPGEASLFTDKGGTWWIVYAPHAVEFREHNPRPVALSRVEFTPQGPYLLHP